MLSSSDFLDIIATFCWESCANRCIPRSTDEMIDITGCLAADL
ncbi:MAG: hypothetical protein ACR2PB_12495 [Desulfocapsaceae bacterium]